MALTLAVIDDASDPSGIVATIAGSSGGSVSLYAQEVGDYTDATWVEIGSRTGDGTIAVAMTTGFYWFHAAEGSALSGIQMVRVTDGLQSVPTRCRQAMATRIGLLGLLTPVGENPLRIFQQWKPTEATLTYPCVVLSEDDVLESRGIDTNVLDMIGFPVRCGIMDNTGGGVVPDQRLMPFYENYRYRITRAFDGQPLPGVPESAYCTIEPAPIWDLSNPAYLFMQTQFVIRAYCRVPRGLGV